MQPFLRTVRAATWATRVGCGWPHAPGHAWRTPRGDELPGSLQTVRLSGAHFQ